MEYGKVELEIPDTLDRSQPLEMGIDEAGRGPVLGPMVYGCSFAAAGFEWPESVDDSKKLTPEQREAILCELKELPIGFGTQVLTAVEISSKMLARTPTNLNAISHNSARLLVQAVLDAGLTVSKLFVDTVGPEKKYQEKLQAWFPSIKVTVSKKADSKFKVVGAASINAKVLRDHILRDFEFDEGDLGLSKEFGSGYPSDPATVAWLNENFDPVFGFPSIARFSWGSITPIFEKNKAVADWDSEPAPPTGSAFYAERNIRIVPV